MDNALKKEIDIQQKFANAVNVVYREKKLGITPCCFSDLVSASIDKYLCDWENTKKYISNIIDTYEILDACESIEKKNSESSNIVNSSNSEYIGKSASAREETPAEEAAVEEAAAEGVDYYYYSEDNGIGFSNLEDEELDLPVLNNDNIQAAVDAYINGDLGEFGDIENWDVSNVTLMNFLFQDKSSFDEDISGWDVSNVTGMRWMFKGATAFNQDISSWDVGNVVDMEVMFENAASFNQDISSWDVSNVTDMVKMFSGATSFNQPIGSWNVSSLEQTGMMFYNADSFNQPLNSWDTGSMLNMDSMFRGASSFNQPIGNWDISNVTNISGMFRDAAAFNQDIGSWNPISLQSASTFFFASPFSTSNYDALLIGWEAALQTAYPSGSGYTLTPFADFGTVLHTTGGSAEAAKNSLISTFNWTITDGNP